MTIVSIPFENILSNHAYCLGMHTYIHRKHTKIFNKTPNSEWHYLGEGRKRDRFRKEFSEL